MKVKVEPRRGCAEVKSLWQRLYFFGSSVEVTVRSRKMGCWSRIPPRKGPLPSRSSLPAGAAGPLAICSPPQPAQAPHFLPAVGAGAAEHRADLGGCWVPTPCPGSASLGLPWPPLPGGARPTAPGREGGVAALQPTLPSGSGLPSQSDTVFPKTHGLWRLRGIFESRSVNVRAGALGMA